MTRGLGATVILMTLGTIVVGPAWAQDGRVEGRVTRPNGTALGGVRISVSAISASTLTDSRGAFGIDLPPGKYTLDFVAGGEHDSASDVVVKPALVTRLDHVVDWELLPELQQVVSAPAAWPERRLSASANVNVFGADEADDTIAFGQLPRQLGALPGADSAQSGLFDFAFNAGGLNHSPAQRLAVRIDGRDPSTPFFGGQDWSVVSPAPGDLSQVELAAGNAGATYGPNSTGGILDLVTKRPGERLGLDLRIGGGDVSSQNAEVAWGQTLGAGWAVKVLGGASKSGDFAESRNGHAEYSVPCTVAGQTDCLPQESVALERRDDDRLTHAAVRVDHDFSNGGLFDIQGGYADAKGPVLTTDLGRLQLLDLTHKWARAAYTVQHWELAGAYNNRSADQQIDLATGDNLFIGGRNFTAEIRTRWDFLSDRLHLLGGLSHEDTQLNSNDKSGILRPTLIQPLNRETLLVRAVKTNAYGEYAQLAYDISDRLRVFGGARYDKSDLFSSQVSPRLGLVFAVQPTQILRVSIGRGFQAPTEEQRYLVHDIAAPVQLATLEQICSLQGVPCGFDLDSKPGEDLTLDPTPDTRIVAMGNRDLKVETVKGLEASYQGSFGADVFVSFGYHYARHEDLITDLVPAFGTALGRFNAALPQYTPPSALPANSGGAFLHPRQDLLNALQATLGAYFPFLTTGFDGTPIVALTSYTNFGAVDIQGADLGVRWRPATGWSVDGQYSWLDLKVKEGAPGLDGLLSLNAPSSRAGASVAYAGSRFDVGVGYRWVGSFRWVSGPFAGEVPSYSTADLHGRVHLGRHIGLSVDVANLFDKRHWETFGGDLMGRRALGSLDLSW
ncbi:MAG: TonB-dependent receptor [Acidobacteriota bacterium]